jgi:hypothetical protein
MSLSPQLPPYAQALIDIISRVKHRPPHSRFIVGVNAFFDKIEPGRDLDQVALRYYQHFLGNQWDWKPWNWQPEDGIIWLKSWKLAYQRQRDRALDILDELNQSYALCEKGIDDLYNSLDLSFDRDYDKLRNALMAAFSAPDVTDFRVYDLGDGEVLEGILALGYRDNGEIMVLAYLTD